MKILLLGGTGTLSSDVLKSSLRDGHQVSILNRGHNNNAVSKSVRIYKADLNIRQSVADALGEDKFDVIVDFYSRKKEDIERLFPILSGKCKQYVFISSACVYKRDALSATPITEPTDKPNPGWSYNIEKYEAERTLIGLVTAERRPHYTIVRPYITYNNQRIPFGIAPAHRYHRTLIERIKSGKPMFLWDKGETFCTLTYSVDFANALVGLFLNPKAENEDFHLTGDFYCKWKDMLSKLYESLSVKPNIVCLSSQQIVRSLPEYNGELLGDRSLNAIFDNSKIKAAVPDAKMSTSIEEGLRLILEQYNKSEDYLYDYKYEGRIDSMLSHYGVKGLRYIKYPNASPNSKRLYLVYRYLPLRLAKRLGKYIE